MLAWKSSSISCGGRWPMALCSRSELYQLTHCRVSHSTWPGRYPAIAPNWRRAWNEVIPFPDHPPEVRGLIRTTNAIGTFNSKIRRAVMPHGHFPGDEAAAMLIDLALNATSTEVEAISARMAQRQKPTCHHVRRTLPDDTTKCVRAQNSAQARLFIWPGFSSGLEAFFGHGIGYFAGRHAGIIRTSQDLENGIIDRFTFGRRL